MNKSNKRILLLKWLTFGYILLSFFACDIKTLVKNDVKEAVFTYETSIGKSSYFQYFNGVNFSSENTTKDSLNRDILNIDKLYTRYGSLYLGNASSRVFISPGDSIRIEMRNEDSKDYLFFTGKYAAHYNYFRLQLQLLLDYPEYSNSITDYKEICVEHYTKRKTFLSEYITQNETSKDFQDFSENELLYDYFYYLMIPISNKIVSLDDLPDNYFEDVDVGFFQDESLLNSKKGTLVLDYYVHHYFTKSNRKYNKTEFDSLVKFVNNNFTGKTREYAYMSILDNYSSNLLPDNIALLKSSIIKYKASIAEQTYLDKVNHIESRLALSYTKLPDSIASIGLESLKVNL